MMRTDSILSFWTCLIIRLLLLLKGDVGQLQEIFGKEQKLIDILNRLEMERQSCVADICKILHLSAAEVKVSQIVRLLERSRQSMML